MIKGKIMKIDNNLFDIIKDIKLEKVKNGTAKILIGDRRITEAISRHNLFPQIRKDITNLDFKELK